MHMLAAHASKLLFVKCPHSRIWSVTKCAEPHRGMVVVVVLIVVVVDSSVELLLPPSVLVLVLLPGVVVLVPPSSAATTSATNAFTRGSTDGRSPVFVQPFRSALANALANRDSAPASHSASTALPAPTALASHPSSPAASVPDALILADTHFAPSREAPKPSSFTPEGIPPATASTNASTIAPIAPASPLV